MFSLIASGYHFFIYQPLLNILVFLYQTIGFRDLGLSIIFFTLLIRVVLYPLFSKSAHHTAVAQKLQPRIKEIQEKNKKDRVKQTEEMMALYREHNSHPLAGIGLLLVQLPILIALFRISFAVLAPEKIFADLYGFVPAPETIGTDFLGLINLSERNILIVAFAAIAQYIQAKVTLPKTDPAKELTQAERMGKQMLFIGPVMTVVLLMNFPAVLGLYWLTTSVFSIFQQKAINKKLDQHGAH